MAGQPAASFLQECRTFLLVDFAPHELAPLPTRAALRGDGSPSLPSIETAAPVGTHPPFRAFGAIGKPDRQEYLLS